MIEKTYNIGVEATMNVIGGKWKPIILCNLRHSPLRPSDLKRKIPNLSQKMLTQQLRELEADGIVVRTSYHQVPPKVVYSLSEYGQTLSSVLDALCDWGELHVTTLQEQGVPISLRCEDSFS
ncbi:winged helix-turn-helix transcriptional regulator [Enterococcus hirae]|nr:helix-turn-helix transcriptional regulator [Enterococcus hirae]EMF0183149.1 helix-turn-helix transcriptional regulator [Enterococcus hirae]EMF0597210.1 helix-turn-helix transcriptional regulator [Enterococcus hirae]